MSSPQTASDGSWIYFTDAMDVGQAHVWRMRPDGGGKEQLTSGYSDGEPSPSPDGKRVAYVGVPVGAGSSALTVLNLTTKTTVRVGGTGTDPVWSPTANEIAFIVPDASLNIAQADGSGESVLLKDFPGAPGSVGFNPTVSSLGATYGQIDWSPDGRWLVACSNLGGDLRELVLIERATSDMLPLPFTAREKLCQVTWQS